MAWHSTGTAGFHRGAFCYDAALDLADILVDDSAGALEMIAYQEASVVVYEQMGASVETNPTQFGEEIPSRSSNPVNIHTSTEQVPVNQYDEAVYFARVYADFL